MTAPLNLGNSYNKYTLHEHQSETYQELRMAIAHGYRRVIVQAPCAWGKTIFSAELINNALSKGKHVGFTVPATILLNQTHSKFFNAGIYDVGIMQAQHPLTNAAAPVQIISLQTLKNRKFPDVDIVLVDEAHITHKVLLRWMAENPDKIFVGLTATPGTKGMGKYWEKLIIGGTMEEMIEKGFLCGYRLFGPESHMKPDLSNVPLVGGDFHEGKLSKAMREPKLVGDAVVNWLSRGENRPTLVFCVDRAHAKDVVEAYEKAGVKTGYIDAYTEIDERDEIGRRLEAGDLQVVVNIETCIYGLDWPFLSCIQWLKPTWSSMVLIQGLGRGLRTCDGKSDLIFIDHTDTILKRLGMPNTITFDLDMGEKATASKSRKREKREGDADAPLECLKCGYIKDPGVRKCKCCGYEPHKPSNIVVASGELMEIGASNGAKIKADRNTKQLWYSGLLQIAHERGYQKGWSANQYRQRFDVWPRGLDEVRTEPTTEIRNWVLSKQIAWAKRRDASGSGEKARAAA